jgi:hypothetical protein
MSDLLVKKESYLEDGYFNMPSFIKDKTRINLALQLKLDLILAGKKEEAVKDGVTV